MVTNLNYVLRNHHMGGRAAQKEPVFQSRVRKGNCLKNRVAMSSSLWAKTNNRRECSNISVHWIPLRGRHNGCDGVSNHQPHDCLLNLLFGRRSKKTSKLRVTLVWYVYLISYVKVFLPEYLDLTRWGRVTHIYISKLSISSDNGF